MTLRHAAAALALLLTGPALAQDASDDSPPAEVDAKELLGARAEPPSMEDAAPTFQQGDNAGMSVGTVTSSGASETETVTETRETSVTVGTAGPADSMAMPGAPAIPPAGAPGWGHRPKPGWGHGSGSGGATGPAALAGDWTLFVAGGRSCRVTLTDTPHFGGWAVQTSGCDKDFFLVSRWVGGGSEISFSDAYDKVAGQLRRTGPDRFEGTRGSDGAAIVLTR